MKDKEPDETSKRAFEITKNIKESGLETIRKVRSGDYPDKEPEERLKEIQVKPDIDGRLQEPYDLHPIGSCPNCGYCPHCGVCSHWGSRSYYCGRVAEPEQRLWLDNDDWGLAVPCYTTDDNFPYGWAG